MPDFTMSRSNRSSPAVRVLVTCGITLAGLLLVACSKREATVSTQVLRISQRNEPATIDPQLATLPDEFFITRALSEGLLAPNPDGGPPLPGIAEKWSTSADGLVYTFNLRPNARWSNGDPVTAADFVYTYRRALTPATAAPKASLLFPIRNARAFYRGESTDFTQVGVVAPDAHRLVITLERPDPDLPALAASGPWIPVHPASVERLGQAWTRPGNFVGNGPFLLMEWSPNQRIVVRKNPDYWNAAAIRLDSIQFLAFDSSDTEERAFRAGQLDVTMTVPFSKLDSYRRLSPELLQTVSLHEVRYLSLNTTRPPLDDPRVRRALSLALDRPSLVEKVLKGGQKPAFNFVPPGLGGYNAETTQREDANEARHLLTQAGFPGGKGFPALELSSWAASSNLVPETIQERWRGELGITVMLVQREAQTHLAALAAGDYAIGYAAAIPDYDGTVDLLQHFTSDDAANYPQWRRPAYDALIADRKLAAAEKLLLEEQPVIPLYFNTKYFLRRPVVRGWREDALWTRYYHHVYLDEK
jgi:oligopeptide transport system substrate-binding protein